MNRREALKFIRESSRCVNSTCINPIKKEDMYPNYEPVYLEQRIGKNGAVFILQDNGKHGWDIYFNTGGNNVDESLQQFIAATITKNISG